MNIRKVYIASPFFNPEQVDRVDRIKEVLEDLGIDYFSPKDHNLCDSIAVKEDRERVFKKNMDEIFDADIMIAVTDGKDMGTIFEAGGAFVLSKIKLLTGEPKIIYFAETLKPEQQFNLMLAESGLAVARSIRDLKEILTSDSPSNYSYSGDIE